MKESTVKLAFLVCATWSASVALGCDCAHVSVKQAKKWADVVFRGSITDISGGKVVFRVERVWKGNIGRTFEMPELREEAACIGFWPSQLKVGNDLLVYAKWQPFGSRDGAYFTNICTRTRLSSGAGEDFRKLGRGKPARNSPIPSTTAHLL